MTPEEARKNAEVMLAYAEGKNIQFSHWGIEDWQPCVNPTFQFGKYRYRVQSEQTYRPFKDMEECFKEMRKHDPIGIVESKDKSHRVCIAFLPDEFDELFNEYNFADGSPFGVKEE